MYKRTKRTIALSAVLVGGLLLAGCSVGANSGPAPEAQELETDPSKISGDIRFMTWWAYADDAVIAAFKKEYPNVNVELDFTPIDSYQQKVQSLASSNDLPDVFGSQQILPLAKGGQLLDMNAALDTAAHDMDGNWRETFIPALLSGANQGLDEVTTSGEIWGVPFNAISVANIYNKDIFAEVGIEPAEDFAGLLDNCRALDKAGYIPMSLTGAVWGGWWPALAWDQTMRDESVADFSVESPGFIRGLEIVSEMADAGCWDPSQVTTDIAAETALFLQQKTAQFVSVPENFLKSVADGADFELATSVLPSLDGKTPNRILGGGNANVIVVNAKSENLSAAVAFSKFLTSERLQRELASTQFTIPSIDISLESANPLMGAYLAATSDGFIDPSGYMPAFSTEGQTTWNFEVLPSLLLGKLTPQEAAAAAAGLFNE